MTFTQFYVNHRVRSWRSVKLNRSCGWVCYISDGARVRTHIVSLVTYFAGLFLSAVGCFVLLKGSKGNAWVSLHAHIEPIHVRDLLARSFRDVVADRMHEHRICALANVDLSKLRSTSADTPPLHSFEPCCHWLVSSWTARCLRSVYDLKVYYCTFVEVRQGDTVEVVLVPPVTGV